jgi:transposase
VATGLIAVAAVPTRSGVLRIGEPIGARARQRGVTVFVPLSSCGDHRSWWFIRDTPADVLGCGCLGGHDLGLRSFPGPGRGIGYVMCVQPASWPEPDRRIAAAIAAKYPGKRPRPLAVQIRDRLGEWLRDEQFAAAFGTRGRPGWSPSRLALVTVLQRAEDPTDRPAAEAVRTRIDWQYLLGLGLDDPGFDHTVLSEFRTRVAGGGLEQVALDALLERLAADGLVGATVRRRAGRRPAASDHRGQGRSSPGRPGRESGYFR